MRTDETAGPASRLEGAEIVLIGLCFALCTAIGEVAVRMLQAEVLHQKISLSLHYPWMIPVAVLTLFSVVVLTLVVLGGALRPLREPAVVIGVFTFLVLLGPILTIGRLHSTALLVLAVGISAATGRIAGGRSGFVLRVARTTVPALLAAAIIVPSVWLGARAWRERSDTAALADAPDGAPNVLFIILDTVRAENLEIYGYDLDTMPNLGDLARQGATFLSAWSTSPWTLPSHGSLFTGRYEHELSTDLLTPLDDTFPTLAEHFGERGYLTAGFAANLLFTTPESGLTRGFVHYEAYPVSPSMILYSSLVTRRAFGYLFRLSGSEQKLVRKHADEVTDSFLEWLGGGHDRPFFAFLNYFDAHAPYLPPDSLSTKFGPQRVRRAMHDLSVRGDWTEAELSAEKAQYDGTLAYLDGELGRLLRALDASGLARNTLIVVSADHGEHFGEHGGITDHGNSMYSQLLHVPLIFRFPGRVPAGVEVAEAVSLRDLAATITDMAGQTPAPFPGVSLAPLVHGREIEPSPVLSEVREGVRTPAWLPLSKGPMATVVTDGFQYIRNGDGGEELFHLPSDPDALTNLAASPEHAATLERLRLTMDDLRDNRPSAPPVAAAAGSK